MKELTAFALGLLILFSLSMPASAAPEIPQMVRDLGFEVVQSDDTHRPVYIAGSSRLYATSTTDVEMLFAGELAQLYQLGPEDRIEVSRQSQIGGKIFYRLSQTYRGLPVIGTQLVVQTSARGRVEAILGRVCPRLEVQTERYLPFDRVIETGVADFLERNSETLSRTYREVLSEPRLVIYAAGDESPALAWDATIKIETPERFYLERFFVAARDGRLINSYRQIFDALNRKVYTANSGCLAAFGGTSLPGQSVMNEGGSRGANIATSSSSSIASKTDSLAGSRGPGWDWRSSGTSFEDTRPGRLQCDVIAAPRSADRLRQTPRLRRQEDRHPTRP